MDVTRGTRSSAGGEGRGVVSTAQELQPGSSSPAKAQQRRAPKYAVGHGSCFCWGQVRRHAVKRAARKPNKRFEAPPGMWHCEREDLSLAAPLGASRGCVNSWGAQGGAGHGGTSTSW